MYVYSTVLLYKYRSIAFDGFDFKLQNRVFVSDEFVRKRLRSECEMRNDTKKER